MSNLGKKYHDRHTNRGRVYYWLRGNGFGWVVDKIYRKRAVKKEKK